MSRRRGGGSAAGTSGAAAAAAASGAAPGPAVSQMVTHAFLQHLMAQSYTLESTAKSNLQRMAGAVSGGCRAASAQGALQSGA
jgi:hypothetical protein